MLRIAPELGKLALLTEGADPGPTGAEQTVAALRRNKVPLMSLEAPSWLASQAAFRRELGAERAWYETSRAEYARVRKAWARRGFGCLMIKSAGNAPSFPHTSDNLDILVPPQHGAAARAALRELGYVELRNIEEPEKHLFRKFHNGRCVCAIHVHTRVAWFVGFMDEESLWARRRVSPDDPLVDVPSPEDAVLINLAHAGYENKRLRLQEITRIRHALRAAGDAFDWGYLERVAAARGWLDGLAFMLVVAADVEEALFGASLVPAAQRERFETIAGALPFVARRLAELRSGELTLPLDLDYPFCKRLYYRKILADPAVPVRERWRDVALTLLWGIKLKSRIRPQPGAVVVLSGVDGSGKTAHAQALTEALRLCEIRADYVWTRGGSTGLPGLVSRLRRRLGRGGGQGADAVSRRRAKLENPAARLAWSWLVAIDQLGTYLLRAWLPSRFGRVVVADRGIYDAAVEMDASLPPGARWSRLAIRAMLALAPRPQHAYVLDVSPARARARKRGEAFHVGFEAERFAYRRLAHDLGLETLPTDGAFADANDRLIREVMMGYMRDFETWLNALFRANPSQKNAPDPVWRRSPAT